VTADEKAIVKQLIEVYSWKPDGRDMDAWNAHAENAEQDLPWRDDPERAVFLQNLAWRVGRVRH